MGAILIIVSLFILLINILVGVLRGTNRSALRFGTLLLSVFLAFFLAKGLSSALAGLFVPILEELLASNETLAEFVQTNPEMPDLIRALAQMLVAPILFLLIYVLLKMVTLIIYFVLRKVLRIKGPRKVGSFLGGAGIGLAIGLIGLVVFATPVVGYADFVNRTAIALEDTATRSETAGEGETDSVDLGAYNEQYIRPMSETPVAGLAYTMLGDTLFDSLTTTQWNGADTSLETEWFAIVGVVNEAGKLGDRPVAEYGSDESQAVHAMIGKVGESRILTYLGGNTLSGMADAWLEGQPFFGINAPTMENANAQLLVNGILRVFATTGPEQLTADLDFFADLFDLLVEYDMFTQFSVQSGEEGFVEQMTSSGFLEAACALINTNPRMEPVSRAIHDVGINILVAALGLPEEYKENHAQLMDDMTSALQDSVTESGEINVAQLHAGLNEAFADSGVEIDQATAEVIANGLSREFTPEELAGELTVDQITDRLIERFADAESVGSMIPDRAPEGTFPDGAA